MSIHLDYIDYTYINTFSRKSKFLKTLKKKKECESKALEIVIELIDGGLNKDVLLNKVRSNIF